MSNKDKIIGLKNTMNPAYQYLVNKDVKKILGDKQDISLEGLKSNSVFAKYTKNLDKKSQASLWDRISSFAGNIVSVEELKAILILMDANLEKVDGEKEKKFVIDRNYQPGSESGIFKSTEDERNALLKLVSLFNFDNKDASFPMLKPDGTYEFYRMK